MTVCVIPTPVVAAVGESRGRTGEFVACGVVRMRLNDYDVTEWDYRAGVGFFLHGQEMFGESGQSPFSGDPAA